jgi:hypothetical protein
MEPLVPLHTLGGLGVSEIVGIELTVMVPVALTEPQPPVNGMVYGKVPATVGVPLIVIVFPNHVALTPDGSPLAAPIPVAPVVVKVTLGESAVFIHTEGLDEGGVTVLMAETVIVPVAFTVPQPPVIGIV